MIAKPFLLSLTAATVLLLAGVNAAHAQTLGIDTGSGGDIDEFANGTVGWSFTVGASPVTVTGLGFWDFQSETLFTSHAVGLWNSSGTLLASTTITNSSTAVASNGAFGQWLFNSVTATTLTAGATYTVGAYIPRDPVSNQSDASIYHLTGATTDSRITYSSSLADSSDPLSTGSSATGLVRPTVNVSSYNQGILGPNVRFAAAGSAAAPEPGSIALLALSGLPVVATIARRRRKS